MAQAVNPVMRDVNGDDFDDGLLVRCAARSWRSTRQAGGFDASFNSAELNGNNVVL